MSKTDFDWKNLFHKGESPYFAMYRCGIMGIPLDECTAECFQKGVPLREKDIRSWSDGHWKHCIGDHSRSVINPILKPGVRYSTPILQSTLEDFETYPDGWVGTERRWFPCTKDNKPMQKWGYSKDYKPTLYERSEARALSPVGWVGQNMYAQPMIVIDIDGVGHGVKDEKVIAFGDQFREITQVWECWKKPGSFHLYFKTNRIIPIGHFPYAKLDLMGNQKNAAVYTKDKESNGLPMAELTEDIWQMLLSYLKQRKEERNLE